jgi:hypothetical protein
MGCHSMEVETDADDLGQRFIARCLDTGEKLAINGWLIDNIELI